ncbi:hypothetical protein OG874_18605 [Nocardia sp. NBC_00565]|nr:hypothetical protein [Nocardia sp. NBC_00565]WUC06984.1 hypothetical protein OG874_18605 [Nocardia sp. NBC_00565]
MNSPSRSREWIGLGVLALAVLALSVLQLQRIPAGLEPDRS